MACSCDPYCLGVCEWIDCPRALHNSPRPAVPPISTTSTSPTPSVQTASKRFKFAEEEELSQFAKGLVPDNTNKSTKWALNNLEAWMKARNTSYPDDPVPEDILLSSDPELLNLHLSRFVIETRKANGEMYPPSTLHQLLCGILRFMREHNPECPNFLDKSDNRFRRLQGTLDSYFHKLHSEGIGRHVKHAETISTAEENQLWESGVLNTTTPKGLQNAVFYAIGKIFCLRGGQEHRALRLSQLQRDGDKYVYYENVSKNRNGSFKQLHINSKVVPMFPCPEAQGRCPVHLLDLYISKLPKEAKEKDLFYVRPLDKKPQDPNLPWYSAVPLGKHTLQQKVRNMCAEAGVSGNKTNHSLRATGATELYKKGVPEKLIQERTGHRSLESLRTYERSSEDQHKAVSTLLSAPAIHSGASYSHCFSSTKTKTIDIHPVPSTSQGFMPVSFQNVHGCTINIMSAPQPPLPPPQAPLVDFTETELQSFFSHCSGDYM